MLLPARLGLATICLFTAACATQRPLPPYEKPLARTQFQTVRTTAYTDTESDHRPYGCHNALGSTLCTGPVNSAAADWSRWPAGTIFRIRETAEVCQVDDYGWALSGTNTIDLYKPSRAAMNAWGVHRVNIEVLQWGDVWHSYNVLKERSGYAHVRRMLQEIEGRYTHEPRAAEPPVAPAPAPLQVATASVQSAPPAAVEKQWPRATPVVAPASSGSAVASNPFFR